MKRVDIEKQLKTEAQDHTPDLYGRIVGAARSEGLLNNGSTDYEINSQGQSAAVAVKRKKSSYIVIASLLVAIMIFLAILLPLVMKMPVTPNKITLSSADVYGMGAVSTVRLLGSAMPTRALRRMADVSRTATDAAEANSDDVQAQAEKFNEYFTALDSFLGEDIVSTVSEKNTDEKYPYETKLTIKGKDLNGNTVENVMYYTETLVGTDSDEEEEESIYTLTGIMVVDGKDYALEGQRSYEKEDDETENELKIRAYADKVNFPSNYVEMEQEYSVEEGETETEYVYSVYYNGEMIEQTAVEFETEKEGDREEVEYELEFRKGSAKGRYVVERETVGNSVQIKVKYNIDGQQGEFRIRELTDDLGDKHYEYSFSDDSKVVF